jgi:hypothetical protein
LKTGRLMQRGYAMLFLYLSPWVLFRVCMASPLVEAAPRIKPSPKVLEPDHPVEAVLERQPAA